MWLKLIQVRYFHAVGLLITSVIASVSITHSTWLLNTSSRINAPSNNTFGVSIWKRPHVWGATLSKVYQWGQNLLSLSVVLFLRFTSLESRHADLLSAAVESRRNARSVCLASRSTVRVSGGLKCSWGTVVGRHSSATFLSCYSHQTALNNQSLFAEIRNRLECSWTLSSW